MTSRARTHFVQHEDDLVVCVGGTDVALDVEAAARERVACVEHLDHDIRQAHHLLELLVEAPAGAICTRARTPDHARVCPRCTPCLELAMAVGAGERKPRCNT
jgi:hypothetical protein